MAKFRWHRGSLADSMETVVEVKDMAELRALVEKEFARWFQTVKDLRVEWYCMDTRISWETYIVLADGKAIGFTDGKL